MKKTNKLIERKNWKINYLEAEQIARSKILERFWVLNSGNQAPDSGSNRSQILDAEEVQGFRWLSLGFWKELDKLIFMILYSIKLEVRPQILEGIESGIYRWQKSKEGRVRE